MIKTPLDWQGDTRRKPPRCLPIDCDETLMVAQIAEALLQRIDAIHIPFVAYVAEVRSGAMYYRSGRHPARMLIPSWCFCERSVKAEEGRRATVHGHLIYYVAHELAHLYAGKDAAHGPKFMRVFKKLCPRDLQHYELSYKPRNAKAAGISR